MMILRASLAACVSIWLLPSALRAQAETPPIKVSVAAGVGTAYDLLGVHLELRAAHAALFVGTGVLAFVPALYVGPTGRGAYTPSFGVCAGLRYYSELGEGYFGSLNFTYGGFDGHYDPAIPTTPAVSGSLLTGTGTAGWRRRLEHFFYEFSIGLGVYRLDSPPQADVGGAGSAVGRRVSRGLLPDGSFAVGWEF